MFVIYNFHAFSHLKYKTKMSASNLNCKILNKKKKHQSLKQTLSNADAKKGSSNRSTCHFSTCSQCCHLQFSSSTLQELQQRKACSCQIRMQPSNQRLPLLPKTIKCCTSYINSSSWTSCSCWADLAARQNGAERVFVIQTESHISPQHCCRLSNNHRAEEWPRPPASITSWQLRRDIELRRRQHCGSP